MLPFINYHNIIHKDIIFYAHTNGKQKETLFEHIVRCEKYFTKLYESKNVELIIKRFHQNMHFQNEDASFDFLKNLLIQLIPFHDFGKINPMFQKIKMNHYTGEKYDGLIKYNHSFLSAIIYIDYFFGQLNQNKDICLNKSDKRMLEYIILEHAYIIARHHSDLDDFHCFINQLEDSNTRHLLDNLKENPINGYNGLCYINQMKIMQLVRNFHYEFSSYEYSLKYFYYRLAYSLLVASDYYATSEFMIQKEFDIIGKTLSIQDFQREYNHSELLQNIRDYEKKNYQGSHKNFHEVNDINILRNELFLDAEKRLLNNLDEHIYFLEAPTGSGKSNVALNLSFHLMQNRKKLFYIYPFNTLVEQNKNTLNQLFSKKEYQDQMVVVNSLTPLPQDNHNQEDSQEYYQKLLLDRQFLNYPMILSTHVSLFNQLFGSKKEDIVGFYQLSESVVVLDEIQSYKNKIWSEIIIMLKACAELMNLKIIVMSATLPNLEKLSHQENSVVYLLKNSRVYYEHRLFKNRVKLHYELLKEKMSLKKLYKHVVKKHAPNKKILIEFLTKRSAYEFYRMLKDSDEITVNVKCLTGDDSIIERNKILSFVKSKQLSGVILVATQVIEAGVDIDMDIGYKDISLLDSEEQFLGRINRSCLRNGEVYFFDYDYYEKIYHRDIRASQSLNLKSDDMKDILINKDFSLYYNKVMNILKQNINSQANEEGLDSFFNNDVKNLNFIKISKRMKLIDDNEWLVDVVLCRKIELENGAILDGWKIWNSYKDLLFDNEINFSQKQVKLIEIRSQLNYFFYKVNKDADLQYNDIIGELRCIKDSSEFFIDGKLDREKLEKSSYDFL